MCWHTQNLFQELFPICAWFGKLQFSVQPRAYITMQAPIHLPKHNRAHPSYASDGILHVWNDRFLNEGYHRYDVASDWHHGLHTASHSETICIRSDALLCADLWPSFEWLWSIACCIRFRFHGLHTETISHVFCISIVSIFGMDEWSSFVNRMISYPAKTTVCTLDAPL